MAEKMYCKKCKMYVYQDIRTINLCPRCGGVLQRHIYDPDEFFDRNKKKCLPRTNYAVVREMNIEQFAEWLETYVHRWGGWLEWLQQEVDNGESN